MSTATNENAVYMFEFGVKSDFKFIGLFRQSDGELRNEESRESSDSPFQFLSNFRSALALAEK